MIEGYVAQIDMKRVMLGVDTFINVQRCLRMTGVVNSLPTCYDHATAMNGCYGLMYEVFGEQGRPTLATGGIAALAIDTLADVDALLEISSGLADLSSAQST